MDIFFTDGYVPFSVALLVFLGLFVLELLLLVVGVGLSDLVDDILPDADHDHHFEAFGKALSFVGWGSVPSMIVIMMLFAFFGVAGILVQGVSHNILGHVLWSWIAAAPAIAASFALTHYATRFLAPLMPNVETFAVSRHSLVGRAAKIVYGTASHTLPADAEVRDTHGRAHHVQLKAEQAGDTFTEGDVVYVTRAEGGFFFASRNAPTVYSNTGKDQ
ncbi:YqiJ family protein [Rhizobium sp. BK176]|uniref:YqiJ family protein n=1 Tax=Rhizobium sp. BK176 TaxID=2587071 RepID=UPI00216A8B47|nr:YqiJ family protein [Rhizobium sp. BK176]MCS4089364.1 membrane protein implicated in regulation of membrane protease activity [Rhizobium sp. BK176]